jgi:hypothetical protein
VHSVDHSEQISITTGDAFSFFHPLHLPFEMQAHTEKTKKADPEPGPAFYIALVCAYIFGSGPALRVVVLLLRKFELLP